MSKVERIARMIFIISGVLVFTWITLEMAEADDDVYNFYFQKGAAPQSVVQGGAGQSGKSQNPESLSTNAEMAKTAEQTPANPVNAFITSEQKNDAEDSRAYKRFTAALGYGKSFDDIGSGMNYALGLQYSFNRYWSARIQGRWRDLQSQRSDYLLSDAKGNANRIGGSLSAAFTPLHLELLGHRFLDFAVFAGADTYRKISGDAITPTSLSTGFAPMLGLSALLSFNENAGVELTASRSDKSAYIGANLAFSF